MRVESWVLKHFWRAECFIDIVRGNWLRVLLVEVGLVQELEIGNSNIVNLWHHWKHWILNLNLWEKLLHANA